MGDSRNKKDSKRSDKKTKMETRENSHAAEEAGENTDSKVEEKTPEQIIEDYKAELAEKEDRYLRLVADFDNYKKRNARLYENIVQSAKENVIIPILDVVDNYERALISSDNSNFDTFRKGTELIYQQLQDLLRKEGIEQIKAVGEPFNPNLHEAVMQVESDEYDEGIIVQEMLRGYKLNDKVIRFSKVTVSKGKSAAGGELSDALDKDK